MLVLDASGSMWGQIDGVPKIVIARQTIGDLVGNLDPAISLGLSAYGHRREGDCNDIQTLKPVGSVAPADIIAAVNGLNPKGKTPLSESVRRAAQELDYSRAPATVILVSDGLENCAADPCALASELEEKGIDFTAHVVGFDLKDEEQQALRCVAENTGGLFLAASDAGSLAGALDTVVKTTRETASATPVPPPPPAEEGIQFVAYYKDGGEVIDKEIKWEIFEPQDNEDLSPTRIDFALDDDPKFDLEEGGYLVRATIGLASGEATVAIGPDTERVELVIDAGIVTLGVTRTDGGELIPNGVNWTLFALGEEETQRSRIANTYEGQPTFTVNAGEYVASARIDAARAEARFSVAPGDMKDVTLRLASGVVALKAVLTEGGAPLVGDLSWSVLDAEPDAEGVRGKVASSLDNQPEIELPVGQYVVSANRISMTTEQTVTVEADQRTEYTIALNAGIVTARLGNGFPAWTVYKTDADGNRSRVTTGSGVQPDWTLPAGAYVIEAVDGDRRVSAEVTLVAGDEKLVELAFEE